MGDNLAYDASGQNVVTLTSDDAVALCVNAYGQSAVRAVNAHELLQMAEALGTTLGYALTMGADRADYNPPSGHKHIPKWHTRVVSADWMARALKQGAALTSA